MHFPFIVTSLSWWSFNIDFSRNWSAESHVNRVIQPSGIFTSEVVKRRIIDKARVEDENRSGRRRSSFAYCPMSFFLTRRHAECLLLSLLLDSVRCRYWGPVGVYSLWYRCYSVGRKCHDKIVPFASVRTLVARTFHSYHKYCERLKCLWKIVGISYHRIFYRNPNIIPIWVKVWMLN